MAVVRGPLTGDDPAELVARLWPLAEIAATANTLRRRLDTALPSLRTDLAALPTNFTLAAEVVRFLRAEPMLPPDLCLHPWPPDALRATYDRFDRAFGAALLHAIDARRRP